MYLAHGGVYLAGDILLSILEILKRSRFRDRFENKGRVTAVVAQIPTFLITNKSPVLLGCTRLLRSLRHRGETNLPAATLPA
jgi:glucokinase